MVGNAGSRADWENPNRWLSIATCSTAQSPQEGLQQVKMAKSIIYQDDIDLGFDLKIKDFLTKPLHEATTTENTKTIM